MARIPTMSRTTTVVLLFTVLTIAGLTVPVTLAYESVRFVVLRPPELLLTDVEELAVLDFSQMGDLEQSDTRDDGGGSGSFLEELVGNTLADVLLDILTPDERAAIEEGLGPYVAKAVRQRLETAQSETEQLFRITPRDEILRAALETGVDLEQPCDDEQVARVGTELGVQAIVCGTIGYTGHTKDFTRTVSKAEAGEIVEREYDCRSVRSSVKLWIRVIRPSDGTVLGTKRFDASAGQEACAPDQDRFALPPVSKFIATATSQLPDIVPSYFVPFLAGAKLEFQKVKKRAYRDDAFRAIQAATDNELDEAIAMFRKILDEHPGDAKVLHNLGIVHEVAGDLEGAEDCYEKAMRQKAEKRYKKALERIARRRHEIARLAELKIVVPVQPPE